MLLLYLHIMRFFYWIWVNTKNYIHFTNNQETLLFHHDEDCINFNTFAKHQELKDQTIDKGNISIVEYIMNILKTKEIYNYYKLYQYQLVMVQ